MKLNKDKKLVAVSDSKKEYKFKLVDKNLYQIKDEKYLFHLLQENDGFIELTVNGKTYMIELVSHKQNSCDVMVNGVSYSFTIETPFSLIRKKLLAQQIGNSKQELIKAPMPGKILDILVSKDQIVTKGEPVIVLEAMKMQNSITATTKGKIISISCKKDDIVNKHDVLIEIEKI